MEAIREDGPTYTAWERLNYLKATVDFVQAFDEAALILAPDGPVEKLLQQAEAAKAAGKTEEASRLAEQAVGEMRRAPLGRAMQSYTRRLTTQGDFGNLATLNVKAYIAFRNLWQRAEAVLGGLRPLPTAESSRGLLVVARRPPSAAAEGVPFPVQAVACTERVPDRVVLHYRKPGHDPR